MKTVPAAMIAVLAIFGGVGRAEAVQVLDTGTPGGSSEFVVGTANSYAAEFSLSAGETVTSASAYLKLATGNSTGYTLEIFSNNPSFLGARSPGLEASASGLLSSTAAGWDTLTFNWTAPTSGNYWLAVLDTNSGSTLDLQSETSTTTGTAPALEFAYSSTPGRSYTALNSGVGMQVTAVPLPGAALLLLTGLGGFATALRRRLPT